MQMAVPRTSLPTETERPTNTEPGTILVVTALPADAEALGATIRSAGEIAISVAPEDLAALLGDEIHAVILTEEALQAGSIETLAEWAAAQPDWSALPVLIFLDEPDEIAPWVHDCIRDTSGLHPMPLPGTASPELLLSAIRAAVAARRRQFRLRTSLTELKAENDRIRMLSQEVQHRARNTLTKLGAILDLMWRRAPSPDDFIESFRRRLEVMARGLDLLTLAEAHHGASLRDLIETEVGASIGGPPGKSLVAEGGHFSLRERAALAMHLVIHELATNAMKYGGLSNPAGRVVVQWALESDANGLHLAVDWREQNGPVVGSPAKGFGAVLIERSLAECGGTAKLMFPPEGVRCAMRIPFDALVDESSAPEVPR